MHLLILESKEEIFSLSLHSVFFLILFHWVYSLYSLCIIVIGGALLLFSSRYKFGIIVCTRVTLVEFPHNKVLIVY